MCEGVVLVASAVTGPPTWVSGTRRVTRPLFTLAVEVLLGTVTPPEMTGAGVRVRLERPVGALRTQVEAVALMVTSAP